VNLKGMIYGAHAALNLFRAQGYGILIDTGSIDSEVPLVYQASYAASKAAVLSLSRTLSEELRLTDQDAIKVTTIMPWAVDTPWLTHAATYTSTSHGWPQWMPPATLSMPSCAPVPIRISK